MQIIKLLHILLHLSTAFAFEADPNYTEDRKIWSICNSTSVDYNSNRTTVTCKCGSDILKTIECNNNADSIHIQSCYCMFYDTSENSTLAGNCMMTCFNAGRKSFRSITRYSVENGSLFNNEMCSSDFDIHREGHFCGCCKEGYGLAAYSYHYTSCIPCKDYSYKNWLRYFTVALFPLTVFYFAVVLLKINIFSSWISGIVFAIQCLVSPFQQHVYDGWIYTVEGGSPSAIYKCLNIFLSLAGIVNLDFFRTLYPFFCLHPKLNILHVASLDFIVALYPFFLIFLTYLLVTMHDRNYRLVVWAWKPFKYCLERYQRQFKIKGSLTEVLASFILLSNIKILGVCFDLLAPTKAFNETGSTSKEKFLYYDANILYLSSEHLPFVLLALLIGLIFVVLPFFLLLLYPCHCFQRVLNCFGWKCQFLHIFMDACQGSYKTKPHDLRFFSAYYLLLRFLILLTSANTEPAFYISVTTVVVIVGGNIFTIFQPYKNNWHNKLDIVIILTMVFFYTSCTGNAIASNFD